VPGLGTSFGRGGATTAQQDLANADAILIMGSNMAENHPVGFQWVVEAREKNRAKVIHVDPRFTRTSAMSDLWVPLRAGSDILFLGGLVNYVLTHDKWFHEYVVHYTNAPRIIREDFRDTEELGGYFSGWDAEAKKYNPESWAYQGTPDQQKAKGISSAEIPGHEEASGGHGKERGGEAAHLGQVDEDPSLQHPRCVFQILRKHFARYTPEMVEEHCGVPKELFLKVAETFTNASGPDKTGAICYAVGWTQHSKGVQVIRTAAILQLLLGNIGRPGGGILALRGHASIQGSTDIPTLYDILPGYLPMPALPPQQAKSGPVGDPAQPGANGLKAYIRKNTSRTSVWADFDRYITSLLKAYYGEGATQENDWGFDWLPRVTGDHSEFGYTLDMADGKVEGFFVIGQNQVIGAPNGRLQRRALAKLKWLVVRDMVETEVASFWKDSPEVGRGELRPEEIGTEVFLMPAAGQAEKDGTFTNTQRMLQYHEQAVKPPGDARSETWFIYHLGRRLKAQAAQNSLPRDAGLRALTWNYSTPGSMAEPYVPEIVAEINGYTVADRKLLKNYGELRNDGSTACGCWIYSGVMPNPGENKADQRRPAGPYGHGWGFAWPNDVRILYNRCSARPDGRPWSERKKLVWWDKEKQQWTGNDTPDFPRQKAPDDPGDWENGHGAMALPGDKPFVLHPDGAGWIWVASGLKDGPLPTHFEPLESLFHNPLYPGVDNNPPADKKERPDNPYAKFDDPRFPFMLTTYRLTEHHTAGGMSRTLSHLAELQPEMFCEVSPELAGELGLQHGEYATITTMRAVIEARVLVTPRMRPLWVAGRRVHQVGVPYHFGYKGLVQGDAANDLLAISEEPNVRIMETKALLCNVEPGRRPRGAAALEYLEKIQERAA
jgi:formate dehydrogenase major subunit